MSLGSAIAEVVERKCYSHDSSALQTFIGGIYIDGMTRQNRLGT